MATVHLDRLARNLETLRERARADVLAVVKADAYGHRVVPVARRLVEAGAWGLGVSSPAEGLELRESGIDAPVLVFDGCRPDEARATAAAGLAVVVDDRTEAVALDAAARAQGRRVAVHVKVDTGMGRMGVSPEAFPSFLELVDALEGLELGGAMTHLSSAEDPDPEAQAYTRRQVARFDAAVVAARAAGRVIPRTHVANSAGVLYHGAGDDRPGADPDASRAPGAGREGPARLHHDLVRPGLALYGVHPHPRSRYTVPLEPVMELRSRVLRVRAVEAGVPLSYRRLFTTHRPSRVALLGIGYADGLPVALSNRGEVVLGGERAPILGAVTMDLTLVDVTEIPGVRPDDEAVIFGGPDGPGVEEQAERSGRISYELLCAVGPRVPRVHVDAGEEAARAGLQPPTRHVGIG